MHGTCWGSRLGEMLWNHRDCEHLWTILHSTRRDQYILQGIRETSSLTPSPVIGPVFWSCAQQRRQCYCPTLCWWKKPTCVSSYWGICTSQSYNTQAMAQRCEAILRWHTSNWPIQWVHAISKLPCHSENSTWKNVPQTPWKAYQLRTSCRRHEWKQYLWHWYG